MSLETQSTTNAGPVVSLNFDNYVEDECQSEVTTSSMLLEQAQFNDIGILLNLTKSNGSICLIITYHHVHHHMCYHVHILMVVIVNVFLACKISLASVQSEVGCCILWSMFKSPS